MKKSELIGLRGRISGLAAAGRAIRAKIAVAFDRAKYDLWNEKRSVGSDARAALLAYAFLRGVPYRVVEPTAVVPGGMTEKGWRKELACEIAHEAGESAGEHPAIEADVEAWLSVPEQMDRKARREAAEKAGRERRADNRARHADQRMQARVSA